MGNLQIELANLQRNLDLTEAYMGEVAEEFWRNGGVCCPSCGVPGYSELVNKQIRRMDRVVQIKKKLGEVK
jgi:50S ribosomal subunit-associated GTPase HflX